MHAGKDNWAVDGASECAIDSNALSIVLGDHYGYHEGFQLLIN